MTVTQTFSSSTKSWVQFQLAWRTERESQGKIWTLITEKTGNLFLLNETNQINFETYKARDYYHLLLVKKYQSPHTCPEKRYSSRHRELNTDRRF